MPFLRFTRDKRGYEQFALVHPTTNRRGKVRTRVLYWYRTPPGVRVGREPFDDSMRRAIEAQHPDIAFDWRKIIETPIPSAETEKWRERRRAEKAEKAARRAAAASESSSEEGDEVDVSLAGEESGDGSAELPAELDLRVISQLTADAEFTTAAESTAAADSTAGGESPAAPESPAELDLRVISQQVASSQQVAQTQPTPADTSADPQRRRRRRRRGRRSHGPAPATEQPPAAAPPLESDDDRERE